MFSSWFRLVRPVTHSVIKGDYDCNKLRCVRTASFVE